MREKNFTRTMSITKKRAQVILLIFCLSELSGSLLDSFSAPLPTEVSSGPTLNPDVVLDPPSFERTWKSLSLAYFISTGFIHTLNGRVQHQGPYDGSIVDPKLLDNHFKNHHIKSVAQGRHRYFFGFSLVRGKWSFVALLLVL